MMDIKELAIKDVKLLTPKLHADQRGYVSEIMRAGQMKQLGVPIEFVQENQSMSRKKFTVRGLHAQSPSHAQAKLVRVLRGRIIDVAIDIRKGSKTFGQSVSVTLSQDDPSQMFIPAGFLHGFCTLEDDTVVLYKMSSFYAPGQEIGAFWNDPSLGLDWPMTPEQAIVSEKDKNLPLLKDLEPKDWS